MTGELANLFITLDWITAIQVVILGFIGGALSGVIGSGGGLFITPGMMKLGGQGGGGGAGHGAASGAGANLYISAVFIGILTLVALSMLRDLMKNTEEGTGPSKKI